MAKEREQSTAQEKAAAAGPELRLIDRRAFVGFPALTLAPGLVISDFALQIPEVSFPFNVSGGPARYQKKRLHFGFLEVSIDAEVVARRISELAGRIAELEDLKLHFRPGYLEGQARLATGERTPVTFKIAFDGDAEKLALYVYDVRLYGFSAVAAPQIPVMLARAVEELELLPGIELRGASGFSSRVLPPLVERAAVERGYKVPSLEQARLSTADVSGQGLRLRFSAGGLPPAAAPDEELLLALEGARAFAEAEQLIAHGKLAEARKAYLQAGDAKEAHPFAAERLLALLVADPTAHELALDLAASLAQRRDRSATALWAEAAVREHRGEHARAAERYLALCGLSRKNAEEAAAFFAAEAATRAARDHAPQMAVKALHEVLGLKPDHLPSLKQLAKSADQANDRAGAIRAYRRIAALARDPSDAAEAHVQMARLSALTEDDLAGARLHCEAALKLSPDHPEALHLLGDLCHRAGEHLRALKALDRLREVALGRHELEKVGRANLLAGRVWEDGLEQLENALLRYREAVSLMPGEPEPLFYAARAAEKLGHVQEAVGGYQQTIELAGPAPRSEEIRKVAHRAHHAMAQLFRTRLGDPARAHEHLEAALALDPRDREAIEELLPYFRSSGKNAELADALEKAAQITDSPDRRAAYWAEAGELYRGRLGKPEKAERLLSSALEADGRNKLALEGMLALAESRRDGALLSRCLKSLAELSQEAKERGRYFRRLSVAARDLAFDLDLAAYALNEVLKAEPEDLSALGELCGLQRRRADMNGLASALEMRARAAEAQNDKRLAGAALRELAQILEARLGRMGEALVALEKAARLSPDPAVLFDLADLSLRCERPEHARRALEDLLIAQPHASPERIADVRSKLGRACEMLGDKDAARENYALAFPLRRLDEALAGHLAGLYEEAGQRKEVAELWASRAQALLAEDRPAEAAPLFLKSGQILLQLGDKAAAVLRLNAALDASPDDAQSAEVLESLAELELERGAKPEAARLIARRASLVLDAKSAAKLYYRAATLCGDAPREEELLAEALAKDPQYGAALMRRAQLQLEKNPRAALADLEKILDTPLGEPGAPDQTERISLSRRAGQAALKAGKTDAARRHLAFYAEHRPDDLDVQKQLVDLHRRAGAKEPLADALGELWAKLSGEERVEALRELSELELGLGRRARALDALRNLLAEAQDLGAARKLLDLLGDGEDGLDERLSLISALLPQSKGSEHTELLVRRSRLYRRADKLELAQKDLAEAAESAASPGALLRESAELARAMGDERAEMEAWRAAASKDPKLASDAAPRMLELARSSLAAKDAELARSGFEACAALPLSPADRCEAHFGIAEACLLLKDAEGAADALREASKEGPPKRRAEALMRRAALLESAGDLSGAEESFAGALAVLPRDEAATQGLKRVLRALEDWEALAEVLAEEASRAPKSSAAPLFEELGALYADQLSLKGPAEVAFRRVAQLDPNNTAARRRLVALLAERGEWPELANFAEEAAAGLPGDEAAPLLRDAARAAQKAQQPELALRLYRKAHALEPAEGEALEAMSDLLYLQGALQEALPFTEALADAIDFKDAPDRAEEVYLRLADLAEHAGKTQLAESALRTVVKERPLSLVAAERLSASLAKRDPRQSVEVLWRHAKERAPSEQTLALLEKLSERARRELSDTELAATILRRAVELAPEPAGQRKALAQLYREAGRNPELAEQLQAIAEQCTKDGDLPGAIDAYAEQAELAERAGRIDDALKTLASIRDLCEEEGESVRAAAYERRRAELFRDAKLDLDSAQAALEKSFELHKSLETARAGIALATRRDDPEAHADWLDRSVDLLVDKSERAKTLLELAQLYEGPLGAPNQAEAALLEALRLQPNLHAAEEQLVGLFERQGRPGDLAAYYEESAQKAPTPKERSRLLLVASHLYQDRAHKPDAAAAALLAARAASPDDLELTAQCAELLQEIGRDQDAAEFDSLLLEQDPFRKGVFERHAEHLKKHDEHQALAALMLRRAEKQEGPEAAESYLEAARAFRRAGAEERARICEEEAFERSPASDEAFEALKARREGDPRGMAELLDRRAEVASDEDRVRLLRERADALLRAGETLLAAEAFDDLLAAAGDDVPALVARAELAADAGGPAAAQPYDRKLLSAGGGALPVPVRVKAHLRLGHAALGSGAYKDAADAFEAVVSLDKDGEKGREALSLLAEVHARNQDADGLFRTSLALAKTARSDEAEALLRRAAGLYEDPRRAIDALWPLARLRPSDTGVVERAAKGLSALGRFSDLVELYEKSALALGGQKAAERLIEAARIANEELKDPSRALELTRKAGELDPENPIALRALAEDQRNRADLSGLKKTLITLIDATSDEDEASLLRVELAEILGAEGEDAAARNELDAVVKRGKSGAGYAEALEALTPLLERLGNDAALADALAARAEISEGKAQADFFLGAARAYERSGKEADAIRLARAAAASQPSAEALVLLARLWRRQQQPGKAAPALIQAAELSPPEAKGALLVEAADAHEAAGESAEARAVLERIARDHPGMLEPDVLSARLAKLGAAKAAADLGFAPAMEAGDYVRALKLAEDAKEPKRVREALWALVSTQGDALYAGRLSRDLRAQEDWAELLRLARTLEKAGSPMVAASIYETLAFLPPSDIQAESTARLLFVTESDELVLRAAQHLSEQNPSALVELVLGKCRALPDADRLDALTTAAKNLPSRRKELLREVVEQSLSLGHPEAAAHVLGQLVELETEPKPRAAVLAELGEIQLKQLDQKDAAKESFQRALAEDPSSAQAAQQLLALYQLPEDAAKFVAVAEQVGPEALGDRREALAAAYEQLGRNADAKKVLDALPESPARLQRRAALAQALGYPGEALQLQEKLAQTREQFEEILLGYLRANLIPFALKLATRLVEEGPLPKATTRLLAERMSSSVEGPALAARLWPELLRENVTDADGWTLYAEALKALGREEASLLADGFGAALTGSTATAPNTPIIPVAAPRSPLDSARGERGLAEITASSMPRLHLALENALTALGAPSVRLFLHPSGGVEAYLAAPEELVIGAGALGAFGPAELTFLSAVALCLGAKGAALARPGEVDGLEEAARLAFTAYPGSLAASRVCAQLDPQVRGTDPAAVDVGAVLKQSPAFRAIALRGLEILSAASR